MKLYQKWIFLYSPSVFVPAKAFEAKQITPDKTAADRFKVFDLVFVLLLQFQRLQPMLQSKHSK